MEGECKQNIPTSFSSQPGSCIFSNTEEATSAASMAHQTMFLLLNRRLLAKLQLI